MSSWIVRSVNRLLPFATPGTPLIQDLTHLGLLCTVLYFAPYFQTLLAQRAPSLREEAHAIHNANQVPEVPAQDAQANHGNDAEAAPILQAGPDTADEDQDQAAPAPPNNIPAAGRAEAAAAAAVAAQPAEAGVPRPAPERPEATRANRPIGAKKAKSLARRDQRRAYNEFLRSQGEASRSAEAAGAAEREAALAAERERRAAVEAEVRAREERERELRRESERDHRLREVRAREVAVSLVRDRLLDRGFCDLADVAASLERDVPWVEGLVRAEGLLRAESGREVVMITERKVLVRVGREDLERCWSRLSVSDRGNDGRIPLEDVGRVLEDIIRGRHVLATAS